MNYTTNYHLPQWVESDRIMMEDFNEAMEEIETGLTTANIPPLAIGTYTGNGNKQTIELGFSPRFVIITAQQSGSNDTSFIAISGGSEATSTLVFSETGFTVMVSSVTYAPYPVTNQSGTVYHYLAIR